MVEMPASSYHPRMPAPAGPTPDSPGRDRDPGEPFIVPLCAVFRQHLKREGQKFTPERAQVLDAIIRLDRVFEADEVLFEMRDRGVRVSKATVYRTLKLVQDAGIIEPVLLDQRQSRYQLAYGQPPRDQMICIETGEVVEFVPPPDLIEIRNRIAAEHGWSPAGHRFQILALSPAAGLAAAEDDDGSDAVADGG